MASKATPATEALRRAGVPHVIHEYEAGALPASGRDRDARPHYGRDAATALGIDPARIFKTLVTDVDGRLVAAVVPVAVELDLKRLADAIGGRRAALANPAAAERATGYVVGGISPLGGRRPLPIVIDASALEHATILVSAGRRGLQVELDPAALVTLTSGRTAVIGRAP